MGDLSKGLNIFTELNEDITAIKNELESELKNQERTIIIFIDDIDRLSDNEIYKVFRLVNSIADFSNLIFFLSFDKNIITKYYFYRKIRNSNSIVER